MDAALAISVEDERDLYPTHEEDSLPEIPAHSRQIRYLIEALQARFPHLWVAGDMCLYWERNPQGPYVAPDVAVFGAPPPDPLPTVWLQWQDAPLLFVLEVGSRSTWGNDVGPKVDTYGEVLKSPEYVYAYSRPERPLDLRMWRAGRDGYERIDLDGSGRVWSEQLGVGFGFDDDRFLRIYTPEGGVLKTYGEMDAQLEQLKAELDRLKRLESKEP
jgi:Uma2 family endonuclease